MKLCEQFGISHSVMFDKDNERKDANVDHPKWNKEVIDAKNPFTTEIKDFKDNLEAYISFNTNVVSFRKPLEILRQLKEGKLSSAHVNEFLAFLNN